MEVELDSLTLVNNENSTVDVTYHLSSKYFTQLVSLLHLVLFHVYGQQLSIQVGCRKKTEGECFPSLYMNDGLITMPGRALLVYQII